MTTPGAWRPQLRRLDGSSTYRPNAANAINRLTSFPVSPSFTSTSAFPAQTTSPIANGHPATPVSFADYRGNGYQPSLIHNATTSWSMEEDELPASTSVAAELPDIKPSVAPKPLSPPAGTCTEQEFVISGVRVKFPFKPYSSQTALMEKVIRCLKSKTNGLLESPTGSGKSLSLLCSSLAWQKSQHAERRAVDGITAPTAPGTKKRNEKQAMRRAPVPPVKKTGPCDCRRSPAATSAVGSDAPVLPPDDLMSEDEDNMSFDDLMNPKASAKRQRTQRGTTGGVLRDTSLANRPTPLPSLPTAPGKCSCSSATQLEQQQPSECQGPPSTEVLQQQEDVPKIYFGSRTHKQITQLVRELRKVPSYSDTKMTILGSKDQYCVHPSVSRERNKNEACQELLDSNKTAGEYFAGHQKGCEYHGGVAPSLPRLFQKGPKGRLPSIFDIEDLMESGKKNVYCPYFMSRELTENAHLIFCPYNYLVDARIRQALKISLEGQIVIFDEGHNMEDAAREAASFTLSSRELKEVLEDMSTVLALNARHRVFSPVTNEIQSVMERLRVLLEWLESNGRNVQADSFGTGNKELSGQDLVAILTEVGLGPDEYKHLEAEYEAIQADKTENEQGGLAAMQIIFDEAGNNQSKTKKVSAVTLNLVRSLVVILDYLYRLGRRHVRDYKGLLAKEMVRNNAYKVDQDNYRRKRKGHEVQEWSFKLHFWCLNPAVAFGDFHQTHSVILTSGTLSPMTSFQSELDMPFKIQFEASHVINMRTRA
ncbi:hypothetical protein RvY_13461-2 [Ramazzottius varieornatus]|uniref:Helicase ATP-binding domain-containing protein n=1 Tax=Ramazzottius varieornatus TaxID=947166 RepID=A0A1D1VRZ5_RAMVA|nr:hypothetical protein RvY_13461-2 [Ramazzottius varieornatus]